VTMTGGNETTTSQDATIIPVAGPSATDLWGGNWLKRVAGNVNPENRGAQP